MFPFQGPPDDNVIRPLDDDDQRLLLGLTHKYGLSSLVCALSALSESSRASTVSATTLLSSASAPSLVWTASDAASIRTQSTREAPPTSVPDMTAIQDPDMAVGAAAVGKVPSDRTWLESPGAMQSPSMPSQPAGAAISSSPRLPITTLKKYQCPMCFLDRNLVEFGRKSDFKKHLNNFHGTDVVWICRTKNCHLSFATERAYSTHAKEAHRMEALPSGAARTELCPQLVFACGFASCKDRVFEAGARDDAAASRDKYFEHIAKHFEDDFDVNDWEYHVQIHNLMRQQRVKSTWKTCIWPKERRQQLTWKPRSSGDLRRMLESRHLGQDISQLVRLAYILGTAPFTSSRTPPPSEIDLHFQLPFRNQCLLETAEPPGGKGAAGGGGGGDDASTTTPSSPVTSTKSRPQSMFRLPSRKGKQNRTRPSTPASSISLPPSTLSSAPMDTPMTGAEHQATSSPHPGTPMPIPREPNLPSDAPKFAPENGDMTLPKQINTPAMTGAHNMNGDTPVTDSPDMYGMPMAHHHPQHQHQHHPQHQEEHHQVYSMYGGPAPTSIPDNMSISSYEHPMGSAPDHDGGPEYTSSEMMYGCTPSSNASVSTIRPATPVPHKRPVSWSRVSAMDDMRSIKRASTPLGSTYGVDAPMVMNHHTESMPPSHPGMVPVAIDQIPNAYGEMIPPHPMYHPAPTSVPGPEWGMPMRMNGHEQPQGGYHDHHPQYAQEGPDMSPMTTFFFDDEGRM